MPDQPNAGTGQTAAQTMPCCPINSDDSSFDCGGSAMQCCAWHHGDSEVSAILFSSDMPRPRQLVAVLPVTAPDAPTLAARPSVSGLAGDLSYVKPVTQKKTDLRI